MATRLVLPPCGAEASSRCRWCETWDVTSRPWALAAGDEVAGTPLGLYIHVPFCERRCGYCAFNTYTTGDVSAAGRQNYVPAASAEIRLAARSLSVDSLTDTAHGDRTRSTSSRAPSGATRPTLETIYFGGGTPSVLSVHEIEQILTAVSREFDVAPGVETTLEANPDGVDRDYLGGLFDAGVNRISFGMQSTSRRVLDLLDRTHDPDFALRAVDEARSVGFEHVSLDLIYGTPGETPADFEASLTAAVSAGVDHVSAYALGIESGTKLAARVKSGALPQPSDDEAADRYATADDLLSAAGFEWYEISNWSRGVEGRSRHNLLYWANSNWWGVGPGAHSHLSGIRWWNVNHPDLWSAPLLGADESGHVAGHEVLDRRQRRLEHVMLGIRLANGLEIDDEIDLGSVSALVDEGLVTVAGGDRLVLTRRGRLLADHVVDRLT